MAAHADLIGVPFLENGRDENGIDCYGLIRELLRRDGVEVPEVLKPGLGKQDETEAIYQDHLHEWAPIPCRPGAIALIRVGRYMSHCGYVATNGRDLVHTWEKSGGVVAEPIKDWKHRIVGFYEYRTK